MYIWSATNKPAMHIQVKKIIAREFLMLLGCFIIVTLTFIVLLILNFNYNRKIIKSETLIAKHYQIQDSLSKEFAKEAQQQVAFTKHVNGSLSAEYAAYSNLELWNRFKDLVKKDSLENKWNSWDTAHKNPFLTYHINSAHELETFINKNIPNLSLQNYNDSVLRSFGRIKSKQEEQVFTQEEKSHYSLIAFLIAFSLLIGLRYLIYGIKWSLKTLKK